MINNKFIGTGVALITPFNSDFSVDYSSLEKLVEYNILNGIDYLVINGTTAESPTINSFERDKIINTVVNVNNNRVPLVLGMGGNDTLRLVKEINSLNLQDISAILSVSPYYNKPTQEGLFHHFKLIADSVDIDQILYNVPGRTAVNMSVETTARLSEISNIIGIKDATGDLTIIRELVKSCPEDFLLLTGDDATALDFLLLGGHGGISVTANVTPKELQKVYMTAIAGNAEVARQANKELTNLHQNLFLESNPIPVKWALHKMGLCSKGIRLPLLELSSEFRPVIENDLKELNLL